MNNCVEVLSIHLQIQQALALLARAMDNRDWLAFRQLLASDVTADFGFGLINGQDALIEFIRSFLDKCGITQHLIGSIVVEIDENMREAKSRAYVNDLHLSSDGTSSAWLRTLGDYHDQWIKVDERWLLKDRIKLNRAYAGTMDVFAGKKS